MRRSPPSSSGAHARSVLCLEGGSSLLLVLWAIMLMAFAVTGLISHLSRGLDESIEAEKDFRARLLLQSARTLASHPDIEWGDPLLRQQVSDNAEYDVFITTEGTRLAVNKLATSEPHRQFAQRLFEKWGFEPRQAQTLVDSLADWVDADERPRPYGAERDYYTRLGRPDLPYNAPFDDLEELLDVRGAEELDLIKPDWRDFFTIYGDGTIDLSRASSEMLEALFDVTDTEVGRFLRHRLGPDGEAYTIDDPHYTTLEEVRRLLDVPPHNYQAVAALLTLNHPIGRIECHAQVGAVERRLTIISGAGLNLVHEY